MTYLKRPWCWERLKVGEGDDRGWDGWMASLTQWTWVWVALGVGDGQGTLTCCSSWGRREWDMTEQLNWIELALSFFGMGMNTDLFQSCGHCGVFQICWHIECSTFTASSFRIWNNSPGVLSPPLALFIMMLPKAHLTSHSRMSRSRWVITPSWLSRSWRSLLYSSVYFCHLFLISSASVR